MGINVQKDYQCIRKNGYYECRHIDGQCECISRNGHYKCIHQGQWTFTTHVRLLMDIMHAWGWTLLVYACWWTLSILVYERTLLMHTREEYCNDGLLFLNKRPTMMCMTNMKKKKRKKKRQKKKAGHCHSKRTGCYYQCMCIDVHCPCQRWTLSMHV